MPINFVHGPFYVSKIFWHRTFSRMKNRGHHNFPSKSCYLTVSKNIVGETFCVSEKKQYRKNLWISGGRTSIHDFSQKFSVSHYRKLRWKTLLCFRKILVSKNVRDKRGGGYPGFSKKLFCLTVTKHFVEEPFCVSEKLLLSKLLMDKTRGVVSHFLSKFLSHTTEKILCGNTSVFQRISGFANYFW